LFRLTHFALLRFGTDPELAQNPTLGLVSLIAHLLNGMIPATMTVFTRTGNGADLIKA